MSEFKFVKGYRDQQELRKSFNDLAKLVFGINFESWYEKGYWTDKYIPFSFLNGDKVVANVSVNLLDILIDGEVKCGIQIGTVMTHPDYRNLGLSKKLMNRVLDEYDGDYELMYLFANDTVLDFYPKFGFQTLDETAYSMSYAPRVNDSKSAIRKLNGERDEDLQFIYEFSKKKVPISRTFGTLHTEELLQFYCIYVFTNDIYYLESEEVIVLYQENDENELHLYDVIAQNEVRFEDILHVIASERTKKVVFHFTMDEREGLALEKDKSNNGLFVRVAEGIKLPKQFRHPITSQA
jgi:GNAT superfamily N-acetyltransferase